MNMKSLVQRLINHSLPRYLFIGGIAFCTDYFLLLFSFYVLPLPITLATSLGFISGLLVSFTANRYWVFGEKGSQRYIGKQGIEYGLLVLFNYGFTVFAVKTLHDHGIPPYVSKVLVMGVILCWNYLIFRKVIFRTKVESRKLN